MSDGPTSPSLPALLECELPHKQARSALLGAIDAYAPSPVLVVLVNGWFGKRWLKFEGKLLGALGVHSGTTNPPFNIPPFVPNRIRAQFAFGRDPQNGSLTPIEFPHIHIHQNSEQNQRRLFREIVGTRAAAIWIGSDADTRWSIMMYARDNRDFAAWYADIDLADDATPQLMGISRAEFEAFAQHASTQSAPLPRSSEGAVSWE